MFGKVSMFFPSSPKPRGSNLDPPTSANSRSDAAFKAEDLAVKGAGAKAAVVAAMVAATARESLVMVADKQRLKLPEGFVFSHVHIQVYARSPNRRLDFQGLSHVVCGYQEDIFNQDDITKSTLAQIRRITISALCYIFCS